MSEWNATESDSADEGRKADAGKAPMDLIPPEALWAMAEVLAFGAKKYAPRNWEKGMDWGRIYGAAQRHMWAWWGGQGRDPETGMSHLWHALCCLAFLTAFEARGSGQDDRPLPDNVTNEGQGNGQD